MIHLFLSLTLTDQHEIVYMQVHIINMQMMEILRDAYAAENQSNISQT